MATKMNSNNKDWVQPFSFHPNDITDEHKKAVEEAAKILDTMGLDKASMVLKEKFHIQEGEKVKSDNFAFVKICEAHNIPLTNNGYIRDNNKLYPILSLCEDVRNLEKLYATIVTSTK